MEDIQSLGRSAARLNQSEQLAQLELDFRDFSGLAGSMFPNSGNVCPSRECPRLVRSFRAEVAMAFDQGLLERLREVTAADGDIAEKKMFGGVALMVGGNMACGIVKEELMVRVGPLAYAEALARPHARELDFTGRPMKGMVMVAQPGFAEDRDLRDWVERGLAFARSLPPK